MLRCAHDFHGCVNVHGKFFYIIFAVMGAWWILTNKILRKLERDRIWSCTVHHRLNLELVLQSYLGSCVQLYSLPETLQPHLLPPHLGSYTRALLVSQDRRHLFVTPCYKCISKGFLLYGETRYYIVYMRNSFFILVCIAYISTIFNYV